MSNTTMCEAAMLNFAQMEIVEFDFPLPVNRQELARQNYFKKTGLKSENKKSIVQLWPKPTHRQCKKRQKYNTSKAKA